MNNILKFIFILLNSYCICISTFALPSSSAVISNSVLDNTFSGNITADGSGAEVNAGIEAVNTDITNSKIINKNIGGTFDAVGANSKINSGLRVNGGEFSGTKGSIKNADITTNTSNANLTASNGGTISVGINAKKIGENGNNTKLSTNYSGANKEVIANNRNIYLGTISGKNITNSASTSIDLSGYSTSDSKVLSNDTRNLAIGNVYQGNTDVVRKGWANDFSRYSTNKEDVEIGNVIVEGYNPNLQDVQVKVGKNSMKFGDSVRARNRAKRDSDTLPMGEEYVYVSKRDISDSLKSNRSGSVSVGNKTIDRNSRTERVHVYVE